MQIHRGLRMKNKRCFLRSMNKSKLTPKKVSDEASHDLFNLLFRFYMQKIDSIYIYAEGSPERDFRNFFIYMKCYPHHKSIHTEARNISPSSWMHHYYAISGYVAAALMLPIYDSLGLLIQERFCIVIEEKLDGRNRHALWKLYWQIMLPPSSGRCPWYSLERDIMPAEQSQ